MQERNDAPARDQTTQLPAVRPPVLSSQRSRPAMHRCPNCGAINRDHAALCLECGENLRTRPQRIRCSQCGKTSSSALVLCPHCGRELVAAPAPWFVWVGSVLLILLFLFVFVGRWGSLYPLGWLRDRVDAGLTMLNELGESMDPNMVIEATPLPEDATPTPSAEAVTPTPVALVAQAALTVTAVITGNPGEPEVVVELPTDTPGPTVTPLSTDTPTAEPSVEPTATATEEPTASPTASATATTTPTEAPTVAATVAPSRTAVISATRALILVPTATSEIAGTAVVTTSASTTSTARVSGVRLASPTSTSTVLPSATLTPTPLPTATPTPIPQQTHRIQNGDTLSAIAARYDVTVAELMAANNISGQAVYTLRPGDELIIPSEVEPTSQATTNTPAAPTPVPQSYTIQAGDTPIAIANRFGISVNELLAANSLSLADARNLRSGQMLVIPGAGTISASALSTVEASAIDTSNNNQQTIRLDQPQLRSPENGAQVSCESGGSLAWSSVNFLRESDRYVLHLGFVNGVAADGSESIVWVLEQPQTGNNTIWPMDVGLCGLAPQEFGRRWYWYVQVVDSAAGNAAVSEPSPSWWFSWN